ncbi:MAG: hypothetical protein COV79_01045 [Parcubacteria group bacterium CG11_big_fil_rev_8_21_14_0_20_41_14]|nr:MAG: hypothetical protein COV79_01045 [Parcubacteria group bacterium CG11_big_fil_rev_8_21_14_0_20_41_14]
MEKPRENFSPQEQENLLSEPSSEQADKTELDLEAEEKQVDIEQATEEAAEDIVEELSHSGELESLREPENRETLKKWISSRVKNFWVAHISGAAAGFAVTSGARIAIKQSAFLYLNGIPGAGIIAGAVAGAAIEGGKTYYRERNKFVAGDIITQLNEAPDDLQKAAIVSKAEKHLKEARINKSPEAKDLADIVRAARLHLEADLHKEELTGKSEAQQISWLLKTSGENLKKIPRSEKKNAKALLKKIEFQSEKSKVDHAKVGKAILKGALVGAIGGTIGGALSHYVFDNLHPGEWLEHAVKPIQEAMPDISQEHAQSIAEQALQEKAEVAAEAVARVIAEGKDQLLKETFTAEATKGDGWTHLARKVVHDYLVNLNELSPDTAPDLTTEQLVHIEDTLVKEQLRSGSKELIHLDQKLELTGAKIQSLIEKAQDLSVKKIENISTVLKEPEHHLSSTTIEWMADTKNISNPSNDFAREIAERAKEAAQIAAATVQEIAVPEIVDKGAEEISKKESVEEVVPEIPDKTPSHIKTILGVLSGGALGAYAAKKIFWKKQVEAVEAKEPEQESPVAKTTVLDEDIEDTVEKPVAQSAPSPIAEKEESEDISPLPAVVAGALAGAAAVEAISSAKEPDHSQDSLDSEAELSNNNETNMENFNTGESPQELIDESEEAEITAEQKPAPSAPDASPATEQITTVEEQLEIDEESEFIRAAAEHIKQRLDKYEELQISDDGKKLTTKKELQERFTELVKKYWNEFATHGFTKGDILERHGDLDAEAALFLLKEAGLVVDRDTLTFVEKGKGKQVLSGTIIDSSETFGVKAEEEGKRLIIDHHTAEPRRDVSSAKLLYNILSNPEFGVLEKKPWLDKFVEYVAKEDNKNYTPDECRDFWENYGRNFASLANVNVSFEEMKKFFEDEKYTPFQKLPDDYIKKLHFIFNRDKQDMREQKPDFVTSRLEKNKKGAEKDIEQMKKDGFVFDSGYSRFGKILIDTGKQDENGVWRHPKLYTDFGFEALRAEGYGGYLIWLPKQNHFRLYTEKLIDFKIPETHNVRGHYLLRPDSNIPLETTWEEILVELAGNPNIQIPAGLTKAIETEATQREQVARAQEAKDQKIAELGAVLADADAKLTGDMVREAATEVQMDAKELLQKVIDMNSGAKKLHAQFSSKVKGKKTDSQQEALLFEVLEEFKKQQDQTKGTTKATIASAPVAPPAVAPTPKSPEPTPGAVPAAASSAPAGPEATPAAEIAPKPEQKDWWEVKRETEVMAVEDLGGDMRLFEKHVATLGVAEKDASGQWQWTGGDKKLVFLGDILGDRDMDGLEITAIIGDLAGQAEKEGGQVVVLYGNHDFEFIKFFRGDGKDGWAKRNASHFTRQSIGIWELTQFDPDPDSELKKIEPQIKSGPNRGSTTEEFKQREEELWDGLYQRMPQILAYMRTDPKGKKILEAICRIKVATIYDDTLYCHTDPTQRMITDLTRGGDINQRVKEINKIFQENLRDVLFRGEKLDNDFEKIEEVYASADNREYFTEQDLFESFTYDLVNLARAKISERMEKESAAGHTGSVDIASEIEDAIVGWEKEHEIHGTNAYVDEIGETAHLYYEYYRAEKSKRDESIIRKMHKSIATLAEKVKSSNPDLDLVKNTVQKVRNSGINAIIHGHSPHTKPRYYDENDFVIVSPHTRFDDSFYLFSPAKKGTSIIRKNGKIDLIGKEFREQAPPAAPKTPAKRVPAAPKAVPAAAVSAPAGPEATPTAEVIEPPKQEAAKTHVDILREHSEKIYQMVVNAKGFDRLHPDTQESLLDAFYETLVMQHQITPDLETFMEKQGGLQLDIQATEDQLKEPENLIFYYPDIDKDNKRDKGDTLIAPVVYDPKKSKRARSRGYESNNQIFGSYGAGPKTFLENQNILKDVPRSILTRGQKDKLAERYPVFFSNKLSRMDGWQELNQETQDNVSDSFLRYFDLHPERVPGISANDVLYSIEISDEDRDKMKKGAPMLIGEIYRRTGVNKNTIVLKLSSRPRSHSSVRSIL